MTWGVVKHDFCGVIYTNLEIASQAHFVYFLHQELAPFFSSSKFLNKHLITAGLKHYSNKVLQKYNQIQLSLIY